MKKLESIAGNDFDVEFINLMIPHHEGAIVIVKETLQKSQRGEIKTLANEIIKAQEGEIKQMKDWLAFSEQVNVNAALNKGITTGN